MRRREWSRHDVEHSLGGSAVFVPLSKKNAIWLHKNSAHHGQKHHEQGRDSRARRDVGGSGKHQTKEARTASARNTITMRKRAHEASKQTISEQQVQHSWCCTNKRVKPRPIYTAMVHNKGSSSREEANTQ